MSSESGAVSGDSAALSDALADARAALHSVFGFEAFRAGQAEIVQCLLGGADVLAVMPTGSGKSLCYQLPAILTGGRPVVCSPLIPLMRDKVLPLQGRGGSRTDSGRVRQEGYRKWRVRWCADR